MRCPNVHGTNFSLLQSFGLYCVNVLEDVVHLNGIRFVKHCAREANRSKRISFYFEIRHWICHLSLCDLGQGILASFEP